MIVCSLATSFRPRMPVDRDIRRRHGGFHISARLLLPSTETRGPGCQRRSIPFRSVYNISYSECAHSPSFCATVRVLMDIIWRFHRLDPGCIGGPLGLSLDTREVGASPSCAATGELLRVARASLCAHTWPGCCATAAPSSCTWATSDSLTAVVWAP